MKKLFSVFLVFLLLVPAVSLAECIDVSSLSYDELVALNQKIQLRLFAESVTGPDGVMLEPGMYEVGVDIPAGNYYFEGVADRYTTSISVYPSIEKTHAIDAIQYVSGIGYGSFAHASKSGKFILKDGWIVEVVQGPAIIRAFTGLF